MSFTFSFNPLQGAMNNKLSGGTPLPPPKSPPGGPGNPGFISKPVQSAGQDINQQKSSGISNVSYGKNSLGQSTMAPVPANVGGANVYGKFGGTGGVDFAAPRPQAPTASPASGTSGPVNATGTTGLQTTGGSTQTPTAPPNQVPGGQNPSSYLTQIQNNEKEFGLRGNAPLQDFNVGNSAGNVSQYNAGLSTALNAPLVAGLQATMPQAFSNGRNVVNPVTGESYGAGGAGQGGAFQGGQIASQQAQGGTYQNQVTAQSQARALGGNLKSLVDQYNINPTNLAPVNGALQWINNKTGDPQYQNFANLVNEISSKYATILTPPGSNPTDYQLQIAHGLLNGLAGGKSIEQVMNEVDQNASTSLSQLYNAGTGGTASGDTTQSSGLYSF